jgi:GNAT superfamily N-acetyltransferase
MNFKYEKEIIHYIGFSTGTINSPSEGTVCIDQTIKECLIHSLRVRKEFRRKGVGTALIKEAERKIAELGYDYSNLYVNKHEWMHKWYERIGYTDTNEPTQKLFVKMEKNLKESEVKK